MLRSHSLKLRQLSLLVGFTGGANNLLGAEAPEHPSSPIVASTAQGSAVALPESGDLELRAALREHRIDGVIDFSRMPIADRVVMEQAHQVTLTAQPQVLAAHNIWQAAHHAASTGDLTGICAATLAAPDLAFELAVQARCQADYCSAVADVLASSYRYRMDRRHGYLDARDGRLLGVAKLKYTELRALASQTSEARLKYNRSRTNRVSVRKIEREFRQRVGLDPVQAPASASGDGATD